MNNGHNNRFPSGIRRTLLLVLSSSLALQVHGSLVYYNVPSSHPGPNTTSDGASAVASWRKTADTLIGTFERDTNSESDARIA